MQRDDKRPARQEAAGRLQAQTGLGRTHILRLLFSMLTTEAGSKMQSRKGF